jgi:uncharacterized protein YndB with AHSA1/START domain
MAASDASASKAVNKKAPDLVLTRVFDAPREVVFKLWTDKKHVAQWWGPRGFRTTIREMDVRPGGRWRYAMRAPNGYDYPFDGVFVEVVEPERLVFDGAIHGDPSQSVWTEVTFAESEGKTKVTVRQVYSFESSATRGALVGWNQQFDRLLEYLLRL